MNINAEFYKGKDLFENGKYEDALGTLLQCYEYSIKNNNNDINEITFLNIIALCYERLGNYNKQLEYDKECYELSKKMFGEAHKNTLICLNNLAKSYKNVGNYEKQLECNKKRYELNKKILGEMHSTTLESLGQLAESYGDIGDYDKQLEYNKKCYELDKRILGEEHKETLICLGNLASSYGNTGNYKKQLEYDKKCYELSKKVFGEKHPNTLTSLSNLASSYGDVGNYEKQLEYNKKCYELDKEIWGNEHPTTLIGLSKLAHSYGVVGNYEKELEYNEKCYELRKMKLGEDHPDTLISLSNLAHSYGVVGNYEKELKYNEKCYELRKMKLGEYHPDILTSLNNLAHSYGDVGNYEKQLEYNEKCYELSTKLLGERHPYTLLSLNSLASSYGKIGNYEKQLEYNEKCYVLNKKVLGELHPYTLLSLNNLALSYANIGNYEKQLKYNEKCHELLEKILGEDHPYTLSSLNNLASSYGNVGDYEKCLEYNRKCYELRKEILGEEHLDTLTSLSNIAVCYRNVKNYEKALECNEKCYKLFYKVLGQDHPTTITSLSNLASNYGDVENYEKQVKCNLKCYELRKKILGENHPDTLTSLNNLALSYADIGNYEKTLEYNEKCYELSKKVLGENHPHTLSTINNKLYLYFETKKYDDYEKCYKEYINLQNRNIFNLFSVIQKGDYKKYLSGFVQLTKDYTSYYFMYKNDKNDYHYIVSYKNILQDIEIIEYKLRKIPEYIQKSNYVNELDKKISEEIDPRIIVNLQSQRETANNELKKITEQYQNQLLLDVDYQMIIDRLDDSNLLLDYYQLNNQYGLVIIGKDVFESIVVDDYGLDYIIKYLDNIDHIYICPDGELYNVSFERLIDKKISYLSSPKALFMDNDTSNNEDIVSFVSPDFSDTLDDDGNDTRGGKKSQLLGSLVEGHYIDRIFSNVKTYSGKKASATHFMEVESPSILHVSTHGDYLEDKTNIMEKGILCLAGYNLDNKKEEYGKGYVSANDIQYMNLKNTDLVVLSACNTAKGEVLPGEGVYGLRRAFELAGAKTLLITVEEINDHNAAIFMKNFYQRYHESRNAYQSFLETKTYLQNNQNALKELEIYVNEFPEDMKRKYSNTYQYQIKSYLELCKEKGYLLRGEDQKEDFNGFIIQGRISR